MVDNLYIPKLKWKSNNPQNIHFDDPWLYDMWQWACPNVIGCLVASTVLSSKDFPIYILKNIKQKNIQIVKDLTPTF